MKHENINLSLEWKKIKTFTYIRQSNLFGIIQGGIYDDLRINHLKD